MGRTVKKQSTELTPSQQKRREELREYASKDFPWFAENFLRIMDRDNPAGPKIVPFKLNPCQRELHNLIERIKAFNLRRTRAMNAIDSRIPASEFPVEVAVLKARKGGVSTMLRARQFWRAETTPHLRAIVMAHEKKSARTIKKIGDTFHYQWPNPETSGTTLVDPKTGEPAPDIRIPINRLADDIMEWDPKHGSSMVVQTAGSQKGTSRGDTYHFVHVSEHAHYPSSDEVSATLNARVPYHETYYESTANGEGGEFYETWKHGIDIDEAERRLDAGEPMPATWNGAFRFFWPWWKDPGYRVPLGPGERELIDATLSEREQEMRSLYGVDHEQLNFRRKKLTGECTKQSKMAPEDYWEQEYPSCPEDAFVAAGEAVFDRKILSKMAREAEALQPRTFFPHRISENQWDLRPTNATNANVWIYEAPRTGAMYVIGVDAATGKPGGDWSVISVFDRVDGTIAVEVARVRSKIPPAPLGELAIYLAQMYNNAFIVPESNPPGNTTCQRIFDLRYPHVYIRKDVDLIANIGPSNDAFRFGFWQSQNSRSKLVEHGQLLLMDRQVILRTPAAIHEWKVFAKIARTANSAVKPQAPDGENDDCVMADLLALHGAFVPTAGAPPIFVQEERPAIGMPTVLSEEDERNHIHALVEKVKKEAEKKTLRQMRLEEQRFSQSLRSAGRTGSPFS